MEKFKYFVGDQLVRTSARVYTHAVMRRDRVISCCGSLVLAEKEATRRKNAARESIYFCQKCLEASIAGEARVTYTARSGNRSWTENRAVTETPEYYKSRITYWTEELNAIHVVPLETR